MINTRALESMDIVAGCIEADFNADVTTDIVSLKNYDGCLVVITKPAGTGGDDITLALKQCSAVAGTGSKALNIASFYAKVGTQTGVATFTRYDLTTPGTVDTHAVTGTKYTGDTGGSAVSSLDLTSDVSEAMFVIDVRASDLDVANGFDCINYFNDGTKVGNAMLANVTFLLYGARYPSRIPLTSITD